MTGGLNLFTFEECIEHKTSLGKHVAWESMYLLYAARIRLSGFAHLRIGDIVIRAICRTIRVLGPEIRRRRM